MMFGSIIYRINIVALLSILFFTSNLFGQKKNPHIPEAITGIRDTAFVADSSKKKLPPKPYLVNFDDSLYKNSLSTYSRSKSVINFFEYRYTGNIISYLPFSFVNDLGSFGSPNEPIIYGFGYGDMTLSYNNKYFLDSWNTSFNLHRLQTESVNKIEVININKAFLYGFQNNPAAISISTRDTLLSKPISRIRYFQGPNDEGQIDAFFSARILSRLALSFRVTNNSIDNNYINTDYGAWKVNLKGLYKIGDSLFTSIVYHHHILKTPLNGGIDVSSITPSSNGIYDIYPTTNPVVYNTMSNKTHSNTVSADIFGKFIPLGLAKITAEYSATNERFKYGLDTNRVRSDNKQKSFRSYLNYEIALNSLSAELKAGYEFLDYDIDEIDYKHKIHNYYTSAVLRYAVFNGLLNPSVFSKYSYYNKQSAFGYGLDAVLEPLKSLKISFGYSHFGKPYSLVETLDSKTNREQSFDTFQSSVEFNHNNSATSISYFHVSVKNRLIPYLASSAENSPLNTISYFLTDRVYSKGININSSFKFWKLLLSGNLTYYVNEENHLNNYDGTLNTNAGLYYVDTLYNSNLNLKIGFIFYFHDNPNFNVYDFLRLRSASVVLSNNNLENLSYVPDVNDRYRVDFYLAGRIQDAATFYFIYENLLGNFYYIVPYYPMPDGGIRIGISWDFLD